MTWAYRQRGLNPTAKFLLVTIANYADDDGMCYPGIETLATDTCMGRRTVIRNIQELENKGYLEKVIRPGNGSGRKSNVYKLIWSAKKRTSKVPNRHNGQSDKLAHSGTNVPDQHKGQCATFVGQCATVTPEPSEEPSDINSMSEKKSRTPSEKIPDPLDIKLAKWMWEHIDGLAPGQKKPNFTKWSDTIRLMRERDKRSLGDIKAVFMWAHNDSFWKANIRSPEKLREKFDALNVKRLTPSPASPTEKPAVMAQSHKFFKPEPSKKADKGTAMHHISKLTGKRANSV
jgi:DNA-binding MarR family transcriptional regulator